MYYIISRKKPSAVCAYLVIGMIWIIHWGIICAVYITYTVAIGSGLEPIYAAPLYANDLAFIVKSYKIIMERR